MAVSRDAFFPDNVVHNGCISRLTVHANQTNLHPLEVKLKLYKPNGPNCIMNERLLENDLMWPFSCIKYTSKILRKF